MESYPLELVLDTPGFFDGNKQNVGGKRLTLNELEKKVLLKEFPDPRLHFVLVCGAVGCPPIVDFAYTAAGLEEQLDRQTGKALNAPEFIRLKGNQVEFSRIFDWFQADFGGSKKKAIEFINNYRTTKLPAIGAQNRVAPFPGLPNFSVQSSFTFPLGDDLTGGRGSDNYIDRDGSVSFTQFFIDLPIGSNFRLCEEIDLLVVDIGGQSAATGPPRR